MVVEQKKPLAQDAVRDVHVSLECFGLQRALPATVQSLPTKPDVTLEALEGNAGALKNDTEPGYR